MKYVTLKAMCILICLGTTVWCSREKLSRDLIERLLQIPNYEMYGDSSPDRDIVIQERNSNECGNCLKSLPEYTESLQSSHERELRQIVTQKHYPICHLERTIRRLNTDEYEYRPAYYEEVRCKTLPQSDQVVTNEICSSLGFSCVQWNKTIHLTRRRYSRYYLRLLLSIVIRVNAGRRGPWLFSPGVNACGLCTASVTCHTTYETPSNTLCMHELKPYHLREIRKQFSNQR